MTARILNEIYGYIGRFVVFPNDHARVAVTAWIAHTYLIDAFYNTPRLTILSAEKGSGKTRLLEVIGSLVPHPLVSMNMSAAAMYTAVDKFEQTPTILYDEIDRLFEKKENSEIIAIINSGFQRGVKAYRCLYDGKRELEGIEAFCPVVLAGIDTSEVPDTILDRSIIVRMRKRRPNAPNDKVEPYRPKEQLETTARLRESLAAWAKENLEQAKDIRLTLPPGIEDRDADVWEPLFVTAAVCDGCFGCCGSAGEAWEPTVAEAALAFVRDKVDMEPSFGNLLLLDIRRAWNTCKLQGHKEMVTTQELLDVLHRIEESPWQGVDGRALNAMTLAKMLRRYEIRPKTLRVGDKTIRGYDIRDFYGAWETWLPPYERENASPPPPEKSETDETPATYWF